MEHSLSFDTLVEYDAGVPGISIEVELQLAEISIRVAAKVDTGSDRCIFSRECGERLGLDVESGDEQAFRTATGSFIAYGHPVTLITASFPFDSTVYFAKHENMRPNVLGRFGWLDRVMIAINDYEGKLYLGQYK